MNKDNQSSLIKSILVINDKIKAIYLIDGTKINLAWDDNNRPSLNIEETPQYTTED